MEFRTVSIVKHPVESTWRVMRDELPLLGSKVDDIASISVESREQGDSVYRIVNVWRACPPLPGVVAQYLEPDMFAWTDRAEWHDVRRECHWSIEAHHFRDGLLCSGTTTFAHAMGGRGTRISFSGEVGWGKADIPGVPAFMQLPVRKGVEVLMASLVPKNFRKLIDALQRHLDETP